MGLLRVPLRFGLPQMKPFASIRKFLDQSTGFSILSFDQAESSSWCQQSLLILVAVAIVLTTLLVDCANEGWLEVYGLEFVVA